MGCGTRGRRACNALPPPAVALPDAGALAGGRSAGRRKERWPEEGALAGGRSARRRKERSPEKGTLAGLKNPEGAEEASEKGASGVRSLTEQLLFEFQHKLYNSVDPVESEEATEANKVSQRPADVPTPASAGPAPTLLLDLLRQREIIQAREETIALQLRAHMRQMEVLRRVLGFYGAERTDGQS
ncbi:hypothetical protein FOMPIDRAFT_1056764 [Fomitopsis schrenkii]|uniref:Uncharacterized protein n=1 Tax=Fomitopsis schrenkii TaxID=2126942 RepID=S8ERY3_FOMSC|nr:hypothetical protein FOMPIDRAFT_1056764 [Fomitopsis schrenkii]